MTQQQLSLMLAASLSLALATSAAAQERTPPAPHCMDATGVQEVEQASPRSIALRAASGQAYRIDFSEAPASARPPR
jgi:type II secretory pathway component PulF